MTEYIGTAICFQFKLNPSAAKCTTVLFSGGFPLWDHFVDIYVVNESVIPEVASLFGIIIKGSTVKEMEEEHEKRGQELHREGQVGKTKWKWVLNGKAS